MRESKTTTFLSWTIIAFFLLALLYPLINSFGVAFLEEGQFTLQHFQNVFQTGNIGQIFKNSLVIALSSALLSVFIAFLMAFAVNFTNMSPGLKRALSLLIMIPMLLPTITYGFTIIYSIGNQGLFTRLLNIDAPDFYGFKGLLLGYTIYTLPVTFLMINNGMSFIDKRFTLVSRLMGDKYFKRLWTTTLVPLLPSLGAAVIQAFFMAFTDYGIPSYIGGNYEVIATSLYNQMLGTIPNFNNGAVISLMMLLPSIISMAILHYLDKQSIEYDNFSDFRAKENKVRDLCFAILAILVVAFILMIFIPIFIVPFTESWPYNLSWTSKHLVSAFRDSTITKAFTNSVFISLLVAVIGTALAYLAAILTTRSKQPAFIKKAIDLMATISNTIPGMVLGLAFLLVINGTPLKSTFTIIIIANIIHYFSTPYLTLKSSLDKLSKSWETTAALMGDNFFQTVWRILTPNAVTALFEVMSYYFTNSMVTISAVVFLYSTRTILMTTKIQELQYYNKFNEVFILSIMLFLTNLIVRALFNYLSQRNLKKMEAH